MPPRTVTSDSKASSLLDTEKYLRDVSAPKSRNQVAVACKLPNGLKMRLFDMIDVKESTPTGSMTVTASRPRPGAEVTLNGCAVPFGKVPEYSLQMGYAITMVDKDFWDEWSAQNKDSDLLAKKMIFAADRIDLVTDRIKEQHKAGIKSGMEPINPKKPPVVGIRPVEKTMT